MTGETSADYREVGLFEKPSSNLVEREAEPLPEDAVDQPQAATDEALPTVQPFALDESPPVAPALPEIDDPRIGLGSSVPVSPPRNSQIADGNPSGRRPQPPAAGGGRTTSFFGAKDKGTRFVYVVDCSGSMTYHNAIAVAKAELMASLQALEGTQQFQIIFYNQVPHVMKLRGAKQTELYWARDVNKTLAKQFINSMRADLGTDHMPALKQALRMDPDVVFFLTDADEPQLTSGDLQELDQLNNGRARIHCIEFGKGAELRADNFLKRLARLTGGTHRYRDVTTFGP
jgi:Ca-activated chloride channel family protein